MVDFLTQVFGDPLGIAGATNLLQRGLQRLQFARVFQGRELGAHRGQVDFPRRLVAFGIGAGLRVLGEIGGQLAEPAFFGIAEP